MIRAATHIHSDWSYDGSWALEDLAAELKQRGYGAMLTAEHDRGFNQERWRAYGEACAAATATAGIIVVPGIEYSDAENAVHVPVWGADLPFLGEGRRTDDLIEEVAEAGAAAMLAHPGRRDAWRRVGRRSLERLVGIEAWNRKYDGWAPGRLASELCASNEGLTPFFGLDFHTRRQFFPLAMGIDAGPMATPAGVIEALLQRRCRPLAFGLDGERFMRGPGFGAARAAERSRRMMRPAVRRARVALGRA
ncbi:MAG: PHP domain-containing protein [Solirubrobacterales bacterium]